jgi:hypothetical protein
VVVSTQVSRYIRETANSSTTASVAGLLRDSTTEGADVEDLGSSFLATKFHTKKRCRSRRRCRRSKKKSDIIDDEIVPDVYEGVLEGSAIARRIHLLRTREISVG